MTKQVTVRVPATTANLGPGFDSLGCALALYNTVSIALEGDSLCIEGCEEAYRGPENLAAAAYRAAMQQMGLPCEEGLHIVIRADIPVSRGLGSSAALLAAGALAYCVSGAGPTQLALVQGEAQPFADRLRAALPGELSGWQVLPLAVEPCGAQVLSLQA